MESKRRKRTCSGSRAAAAHGELPNSMKALQMPLDSGALISQQDCDGVLSIAEQYLCTTENTVALGHGSKVKPLLRQLPSLLFQSCGGGD